MRLIIFTGSIICTSDSILVPTGDASPTVILSDNEVFNCFSRIRDILSLRRCDASESAFIGDVNLLLLIFMVIHPLVLIN